MKCLIVSTDRTDSSNSFSERQIMFIASFNAMLITVSLMISYNTIVKKKEEEILLIVHDAPTRRHFIPALVNEHNDFLSFGITS